MRKIPCYVCNSLFWIEAARLVIIFFTLLIFPLYEKLYGSYSINKRKFSKTSRDIAANNAIKTLMPRLLMSEFSVSEKRKKWKHCDLNFLDKHKTQFIDLLNIFGKIHFTLIVTHTKLILSKNIRFFCCQLFCLQSCITALCRISIYKLIFDIELSFLSFSFFVQALNMEKKSALVASLT